ncbi:MAG: hypothetical protein OSA24_06440 [Longimicrobiales bacterium]|nr:hypothetical protein [Longimicrobiales bacterium]
MYTVYRAAILGMSFSLALTTSPVTLYGGEDEGMCVEAGVPYYSFQLITTKNILGTGRGRGSVEVTFSDNSPFGISVTSDGSYDYDLKLSLNRIKLRGEGRLVAWVTTRDLSKIRRIGPLDPYYQVNGSVDWNKFLVVVTLESNDGGNSDKWEGPVVFRGMSRSGMMHTMVGHGLLQEENCFAYGYDG